MLSGQGIHRLSVAAGCLAIACAAVLATAAPASAGFTTGIDGDGLFESDEAGHWFDTTAGLHAGIARVDVSWRGVVSGQPADPADPADPAYDFSELDRDVQNAAARNLRVLFVFARAPGFGQEGGGEPEGSSLPAGSWKPKPDALGAFAKAVATRYSGSFGGLPRVRDFEVWNESNLNEFLAPQYDGTKLVSADRYRDMVIAVDEAVDSVRSDNRVVVGSLAPYGDEPGGARTRPLVFLRRLLCLDRRLDATRCPRKTPLDILSHHPINLSGGPRRSALDDDDVSSPDMGAVADLLRAAERKGTIAGKRKRHELWVTEYWWESTPPDPRGAGVPGLRKHARWIEEALYLFWKAGVDAAIYYSLVDRPPAGVLQAGLYFHDGRAKPAAQAFRFPFVTERRGGRSVRAWGKAPAGGKLRIERKTKHGWRAVESKRVKAGKVFTAGLTAHGKATFRARVGSEHSLPWTQRRG